MIRKTFLTIAICMIAMTVISQDETNGPKPFDKFFTKEMSVTEGDFPVYKRGRNYFMEIPASSFGKDILIMGYVRMGNASAIAKSSGIIRFNKGINDYLDATRPIFSEAASGDVNGNMEQVISKSSKLPVNYGYRIEALGKQKNSYIIDITRQITEAGDWFNFSDLSFLSRPDPQRSFVKSITPESKGVRILVERSQTDYMGSSQGPKTPYNASYEIELLFSEATGEKMPRKLAEANTGFETFSFTDYGKVAYTVRKSSFVRKWNVSPAGKRSNGLVAPEKQIKVIIDPKTPDYYQHYIRAGVLAWNEAFKAAGYKDVLSVKVDSDMQLAPGRILISWGNAYTQVLHATVDNPETGEIMMARISLTEGIAKELMIRYLVQCGTLDSRITRNIRDRSVTGDIIQWQITRTMGAVLGLKENLAASTRFAPAQLRNAAFLQANGFSASIMDELPFNYIVQPGDNVPARSLMPRIGTDDIAAIKWAYGRNEQAQSDAWLEEKKNDPLTRRGDLSADPVEAAILGIRNLQRLYPSLDTISAQLDETIDLFNVNGSLYGALQREYLKHLDNVLALIGGVSESPSGNVYVPAAQQRKAMQFLSAYVFSGVPEWMNIKLSRNGQVINSENWLVQMQLHALERLTNTEVLGALTTGSGPDPAEIFSFIDSTVFKSFNSKMALTAAERSLQLGFIDNLAQEAFKANISKGLNDGNVLQHYYLTNTAGKIAELEKSQADWLSRENYRLMKMKIYKEFFDKIKV